MILKNFLSPFRIQQANSHDWDLLTVLITENIEDGGSHQNLGLAPLGSCACLFK